MKPIRTTLADLSNVTIGRRWSSIRHRLPISQEAMDRIYDLPYTRQPHPSYREPIPAFEMIKNSVTIMRGCFGGCTFCSITAHQGRVIQSRSQESILAARLTQMAARSEIQRHVVSDIGGPTANMYQMHCPRPEVEAICRRQSCVHPTICKLLGTDHGPLVQLMRKSREHCRRQQSARRQWNPHGLGTASAGIYA